MGKRTTLYATGQKVALTLDQEAARAKARQKILAACNRRALGMRSMSGRPLVAPFTAKHLQRCVGMARRLGLVDDAVLIEAGFRPSHRPGQPEHIAGGRARRALVKTRRAASARAARLNDQVGWTS